MIYLAQPYTHEDFQIRSARFKVAEFMTVHYMKAGEAIFSPIVHCHKLSRIYQLPTDFDFWMEYDYDIISASKEVRVLKMPGWDKSKGVEAELKFAAENSIPVTFAEWGEIYRLCNEYKDPFGEFPLRYWLDQLK